MSFVGRVNVIGHDVHAMWVYDDGRLIWKRNLDSSKADESVFGAIGPTTGLLEQRLTPEGIQLLRSEALTPDAMIGDNWGHGLGVDWGAVSLRIDGRVSGFTGRRAICQVDWRIPRSGCQPPPGLTGNQRLRRRSVLRWHLGGRF